MTTDADRVVLLRTARDAIVAHVERARVAPPLFVGILGRYGGAFVTIHTNGELRGCIGHIEANEPLGEVLTRCAVAACSADPRFAAVTVSELPHIEIELSLLGPLEPIAGPEDIDIGRHGLVVEQGRYRGLLLPQVATEWNWNRETFLAHTCQKAGLAPDAWKSGASLWRFEADVFGEADMRLR
jgi:uncharacterized protein